MVYVNRLLGGESSSVACWLGDRKLGVSVLTKGKRKFSSMFTSTQMCASEHVQAARKLSVSRCSRD